jgi:hypothetical protein
VPIAPLMLPDPAAPGTFMTLPGREACGVALGSQIVMFAGSTNHMHGDETTNHLYAFDTRTLRYRVLETVGVSPRACVSAEALVYGPYMVILGGWTESGLLRTPHVVNFNFAEGLDRPPAAAAAAAAEAERDVDERDSKRGSASRRGDRAVALNVRNILRLPFGGLGGWLALLAGSAQGSHQSPDADADDDDEEELEEEDDDDDDDYEHDVDPMDEDGDFAEDMVHGEEESEGEFDSAAHVFNEGNEVPEEDEIGASEAETGHGAAMDVGAAINVDSANAASATEGGSAPAASTELRGAFHEVVYDSHANGEPDQL